MLKVAIFSLLVAAPLASVSAANPVDNYASASIAQGDYAIAEATLNAYLSRNHDDPPALLNLAFVYRHTQRPAQAEALYHRVLARLDTPVTNIGNDRSVSSHEVALVALTQRTRLASR